MIGIGHAGYTWLDQANGLLLGDDAATFALLPSDIAGRWFGAFQIKYATLNNTYPPLTAANNLGGRLVVDFRVGGTILFTSQIWCKRQYRPVQMAWQTGAWNESQAWGVVTPSGSFFGSQTYQNAYFLPTSYPSPASYTPSTNPRTHANVLAVHPEPIYVWFDRDDGQTVDIQLRLFGDRPNSTLGNPINDDAPPTGLGVRSAEESIPEASGARFFTDAWFMRIGPGGVESVADLPTGGTIGDLPPET